MEIELDGARVCTRCQYRTADQGYQTCSICRQKRRETRRSRYNTLSLEQRKVLSERTREWQRSNPAKARASQRAWMRGIRQQVILHYGGCCRCCGVTEYDFLTLHHIDGDGADHRESLGLPRNVSGQLFAWKLWKAGLPDANLEVLCWNCHMAIENLGYCPHTQGE